MGSLLSTSLFGESPDIEFAVVVDIDSVPCCAVKLVSTEQFCPLRDTGQTRSVPLHAADVCADEAAGYLSI